MIVLAGGIGSGKSVVARSLRLMGFGVFDCDIEAKRLMESDSALVSLLSSVAGDDIYIEGRLDRQLLASRLFSDSVLRMKVNEAVHSAVRDEISRWLNRSASNLFVESAIAAESGLAQMADQVWFIEASYESRLQRVATRDCRSREQILRIMEAQEGEEERLMNCGKPIKRISNNPDNSLLKRLDDLVSSFKFVN